MKKRKIKSVFGKGEKGLTLVEVLISMVLIMLCAIGTLVAEKQKWFSFGQSDKTNKAIRLIENKIEDIRMGIAQNYTTDTTTAGFATEAASAAGTVTTQGITLVTTVSAAQNNRNPPDALPNVRKVNLTATWTVNGKNGIMKASTYVSKNF
jgi:Tfp pilus assembly protein PilV